jgi:hypothetical protein
VRRKSAVSSAVHARARSDSVAARNAVDGAGKIQDPCIGPVGVGLHGQPSVPAIEDLLVVTANNALLVTHRRRHRENHGLDPESGIPVG